MKKALALASVMLMAGALTACGGGDDNSDSGGSYCDQVNDLKAKTDSLDFTQQTDEEFSDFRSSLRDIEAAAPENAKADWATFNDGLDQVAQLLDDAGLTFEDVQAMQSNGSLPDGVDIAKLQEFAEKMQQLTSQSEMTDASEAIVKNIKDECGIDLVDTSSTTGG
jgi:ABC-type glycerol-3-phosphate transport system substrate-binding protein